MYVVCILYTFLIFNFSQIHKNPPFVNEYKISNQSRIIPRVGVVHENIPFRDAN